jgi:hypothetical protein
MAQMTAATIAQRADDFLSYLAEEWAAIPSVAANWESLSPEDRYDLWLEWPIREERLDELERLRCEGRLTPSQGKRLSELRLVIAAHRPVLEELFAQE